MNSFTKEELEILRNDHFIAGANTLDLYDKLSDMINNFDKHCDHHWLTDPKIMFMSNPPKYKLLCSNCFATKWMLCSEFNMLEQ